MKIAFVYQIDDEHYWKDGLWAALKILEKDWQIDYFNLYFGETYARFKDIQEHDLCLVWGALGSEQANFVVSLQDIKKGICVGGGPVNHPNIHQFDIVFVESPWYVKECRKLGVDAKLAFGTNTKLFKPIPNQSKLWKAIYPAAFAKWKRHKIFAEEWGKKGLAVGYMQPNNWEKECYEICLKNGVTVLPRVMPEVLVWLYNASKLVHITADLMGGGERTVLEGLACGLSVRVERDNPKLMELLKINKKRLWTEEDYAQTLKKEIEEVIRDA